MSSPTLIDATATTTLRLGTRRSRLATTQSQWVADLLRARGHDVELVEVVTEGDVSVAPLTQIGGTGVFASALRQALHEGRIDLAVHSLKDLPVTPEPGLSIAAIPPREDPRDALCSADGLGLEQLRPGARVGTGSPRRAAQLAMLRPDVVIVPIRGNVETRLRRVQTDLDAVVLALAGLRRVGLAQGVSQVLDADQLLPAAGQGALALECRTDRAEIVAALAELDDPGTRAAVEAERALLATLEAGCTAPIGAIATAEAHTGLLLRAFVGGNPEIADGLPSDPGCTARPPRPAFRDSLIGMADHAADLGRALAHRLLEAGAAAFLSDPADTAGSADPRNPATDRTEAVDPDTQECQT